MAAIDNALRDDDGRCDTCRVAYDHAPWCPVGRATFTEFGYSSSREMGEFLVARALGYPSPSDLQRAGRGQPHQRTRTWLREHFLAWMESHGECISTNTRCGATGCRVPREWTPGVSR